MAYWHYVVRRILLILLVMFGAATLIFFAGRAIGNPVALFIGEHQIVDPNVAQEVTKAWGLDKPVWVQFVIYFSNILKGNLGFSFSTGFPVAHDLAIRVPATIELSMAAMFFTLAIGIPVGIVAATHKGSVIDQAGRIFSISGYSAPSFWIGIVLLFIFFRELGWVGSGRLSPQFLPPHYVTGLYTVDSLLAGNLPVFADALQHLVLPGLTLGMAGSAMTMRLLRSSMLEAVSSDYVRTARMKGLRDRVVIYRHAFRNALIPMTTYIGFLVGAFLSGAVLTETIFAWNGVGQYTVNAIFSTDFPALQGVVLFIAFIFATSNFLVDLIYGLIDPRIRVG
jgi:peptide/nickel transport system permease protein